MRGQAYKLVLLVASLATLVLLVAAAYRENVARDWRRLQREYRVALAAEQRDAFAVQLRQVYVPQLGAADRCVSCHVGMAPGEIAIESSALFRAHPPVVHEPADFGCAVCHGGQGRATEIADAHGTVEHWPEPMLPRAHMWAGCGTCHTHLAVPNMAQVDRGRALVERYDCLSCHRLDGRGGTLHPGAGEEIAAPDLSRAGAAGVGRDWYERHLDRHRSATDGRWKSSFGEIAQDDRRAIEALLASRVGAPGLIEAKAVFHSLGCRGCHKINGVGGDDGPDLTHEGLKDPGRTDFTHVRGEHNVPGWLAEHFRAPATVVPGSLMPELGLTEQQISELTFYLLSLRHAERSEAFWPKDRMRAERFGEREFATDGATLYGTFCAACHGPDGEGMRYPGMTAFPAIGNPDFLAVASDRFLTETITHGRPGRRMPAWGDKEGGLRREEIASVVAYVRALAPQAPAPLDEGAQRWAKGDAAEGAKLFAANCASCHGRAGVGGVGPALANAGLLAAATDGYLVETIKRGRTGTGMAAFAAASTTHRLLSDEDIEDIVTFVRNWETKQ
jgi:mono/diheme cytochrome c family protein